MIVLVSLVGAGCALFGSEDPSRPKAPSGLKAESNDDAILLEWTSVQSEDLKGYHVYRSTSSLSSLSAQSLITKEAPIREAGYNDGTVQNGTTYHYVVTAIDDAGNESPPSNEITKTPFTTPPVRP